MSMRAKPWLGFSCAGDTPRKDTRQPFQTSLQREERASLAPDMTEGLLPGLGTKVRRRRIMRSWIQWKRSITRGLAPLYRWPFATFFLPLAEMYSQVPFLWSWPRLFLFCFLLKNSYQHPREWEWYCVSGSQTVCQGAAEHHLRGAPWDIYLFKTGFYLFTFRELGREEERKGQKHGCERETSISCLL